MRIRRKSNECLNCKASLDSIYNYCPICGQENNNNNISIGKLFVEFFSNYLSFDSRMGKSIFPFFFKPGQLTNAYNAGKRVAFMHPVRMYLIISILFFFVFQLASNRVVTASLMEANTQLRKYNDQKNNSEGVLSDSTNLATLDSLKMVADTTIVEVLKESNIDSLTGIPNAPDIVAEEINKGIQEGINAQNKYYQKPDSTEEKNNWNIVEDNIDDRSITNIMLYEMLDMKDASEFEEHFWMQYIRVRRADEYTLVGHIVDSLPLMMLLLIPLFAWLLKLMWIRHKILYIKHLIHALHIHSFVYTIYAIGIMIALIDLQNDSLTDWISFVAIVIVTVYSFISFKRVYHQKFFKTLVKFLFVGFFYSFFLLVFFLGELFVSLMMY